MVKHLEDLTVNVKIKLSVLWICLMFLYLYNDVLSFFRQDIIEETLTGKMGGIEITPIFLLAGAILMAIPIFMVFLSIILPAKINRWTNIIVGIFHAVVLLGTFLAPGDLWPNYALYMILEAVFIILIIWYAWKWPTQEVMSKKGVKKEE